MAKLRVREVAEAQGKTISDLHYDARLPIGTVRRYWYGTSDGKEGSGKQFFEIDLRRLTAIAEALGVKSSELIED